MNYITKLKLASVHQLCDAYDKSTEYTIALMQETCNVDLDCVIKYFELSDEEHSKLVKDIMNLTKTMALLENIKL